MKQFQLHVLGNAIVDLSVQLSDVEFAVQEVPDADIMDGEGVPLARIVRASPGISDPNYESKEDLLFFNVNNLIAARTNGQQGAVDVVQQARLFEDTKLTVPAGTSRTQATIAFDATKLVFLGHSEGGLNGPLFLAGDDQALGGVLSGSGAMITVALLEKTSPMPSVARESVNTASCDDSV